MVREACQAGNPYMMAFVDMRMPPGWDGIETIGHLWAINSNLQIVICTAYSDHSWEQIIARLGQSDGLLVIKKPFDAIEVLQTAHALTRKWLLHHEVNKKMDNLEELVRLRTQDLLQVNSKLQREIEIRKAAEKRLMFLATHDSLTNLPNRILLRDRLTSMLVRAQRYNTYVAVLLLDIDRFKVINDDYGHSLGDVVLQSTATNLSKVVRACDTVARLGGDEFVIILGDISAPEEVDPVAQRVLESLRQEITFDGKRN